jgi:hypothetical protein
MSKPLAEDKTAPRSAAAVDRLRREFEELQQLRKAVAEAERCSLDREQRAKFRPLS